MQSKSANNNRQIYDAHFVIVDLFYISLQCAVESFKIRYIMCLIPLRIASDLVDEKSLDSHENFPFLPKYKMQTFCLNTKTTTFEFPVPVPRPPKDDEMKTQLKYEIEINHLENLRPLHTPNVMCSNFKFIYDSWQHWITLMIRLVFGWQACTVHMDDIVCSKIRVLCVCVFFREREREREGDMAIWNQTKCVAMENQLPHE